MKTKKIFKALAMVMLLPAMLLTTACSNDDDTVNNDNTAKKGYPLQVTINVTRQGDEGTTRATYNESTRKLEFSAGDQLFVYGSKNIDYKFAGTLDYVPASGKFSGTIYTQNEYSGTAQELLEASVVNALLLPAGYDSYHFLTILNPDTYNAQFSVDYTKAFATSKATAVEQFSFEFAAPLPYSSETGFALSPRNPILNFTITGLTPRTNVTATLTYRNTPMISENVTTDGAGNATFTMALQYDDMIAYYGGYDLNDFSLTVGSTAITLVSSSTPLTAGHIYNITRSAVTLPEGALSGKFTINESGNQVRFSKGNLQAVIASGPTDSYNYTASSWKFAENQWDFIGNNPGNTSFDIGTTVDLFGWVGTSASYDTYGLCTQKSYNTAYYGTDANDNLKSDWGNAMGTGWFTLKVNEWDYLLTYRTTGGTVGGTSQARYTLATIRTNVGSGVNGLILFPDGVDIENSTEHFTSLGNVNNTSNYATKCTSAQWTALENKGCVFLPAAGFRYNGTTAGNVGSNGMYWSSSLQSKNFAYQLDFRSGNMDPQYYDRRDYGMSVRLVYEVE